MEAVDEIVMNSKVLDGQFTETATLYGQNENNVLSKTAVNLGSENKVSIAAQVEVDVFGKTKVSHSSDGAIEANGKLQTTIAGGAGVKLELTLEKRTNIRQLGDHKRSISGVRIGTERT